MCRCTKAKLRAAASEHMAMLEQLPERAKAASGTTDKAGKTVAGEKHQLFDPPFQRRQTLAVSQSQHGRA